MEILHRRCAGLEVRQKEIVARRRIVSDRKARSEFARFPTPPEALSSCRRAFRGQGHACGDGSDGRLLETGLACAVLRFQTDP